MEGVQAETVGRMGRRSNRRPPGSIGCNPLAPAESDGALLGEPMAYMPTKQVQAVEWSANFAARINQNASQWGLTTAQATEFQAVNQLLQASYDRVKDKSTRTAVAVADKNVAMQKMKQAARNLVSIIQGTPTVTPGMKKELGITIRNDKPTPEPIPNTEPKLTVSGVTGSTVTATLWESKTKRAKPKGVSLAMIFTHVGPTPPEDESQWQFATTTGRTSVKIPFPPSETGTTAWITAIWQNNRKQSGPACEPVKVNLPATSVLPQPLNAAAGKRKAA
jgi:hypothetical protein